jgi:hypothetical protein
LSFNILNHDNTKLACKGTKKNAHMQAYERKLLILIIVLVLKDNFS